MLSTALLALTIASSAAAADDRVEVTWFGAVW